MKITLSVPSGFHARELLLPLKPFFEKDNAFEKIVCITPGAVNRSAIFPDYGSLFEFVENPTTAKKHEDLLKNLSPDLVVTTTAGLDAKDVDILLAAKKLNIKTFTFVASWDNVWKMERLKQFGKPYVLADHLAVWNNMMKEHLLRAFPELQENQVSISGAPRLDYFWHHDQIPSKDDLYAYLGISDSAKKLIHVATTELYPMDYLVQALAKAKLPCPIQLYASVHPGGDIKKHERYANKYNVSLKYSFGRQENAAHPDFRYNPSLKDIYMLVALFKHSSVLVNHSSTVAIESFAANVPVINVKYGKSFDWWRWYRSMVYRDFQQHYNDIVNDGATKVVTNKKQLINALRNYLQHPEEDQQNRAKTLQKMIMITDGTASEKMYMFIKSLVI